MMEKGWDVEPVDKAFKVPDFLVGERHREIGTLLKLRIKSCFEKGRSLTEVVFVDVEGFLPVSYI